MFVFDRYGNPNGNLPWDGQYVTQDSKLLPSNNIAVLSPSKQQNFKSNAKPYVISREEVGIVGEDLYDKLLDLMTVPEKKKRLTRKKGTSKKKRTTRRRK